MIKKKIAIAVSALALALPIAAVTASEAPAHTPKGGATCDGLWAKMTNAPKDYSYSITLTVDGDSKTTNHTGNDGASRSVPQDYESHSWSYKITGQYGDSNSGSVGPCKTKPTEPPATHTPEPTPTPTEPEDTPSPSETPKPTSTPTPTDTPTSTPTPDIGTPTSSTNPPTSTPSAPHTTTPAVPGTPHSTPSEPSTPHVSKPHGPRTTPHCKITNTDRNADCQPDIGGPNSSVVEEGF